MRIAMIGCKGIPAATSYGGGIETYVEDLAVRLVEEGHRVTVYCRSYANPKRKTSYKGVKLVTLPTIRQKNLDAIVGTFFATVHALFQPFDVLHYHGVGPSTLSWIPRLLKPSARIVATFHSRDQFHEKWGAFARAYLAFGEWAAVTFPHATTTPSHVIQLFCKKLYGRDVHYIPNAVEIPSMHPGKDMLKPLGLEQDGYFFTLCRLVPHKAVDQVIEAFRKVKTDKKLVVIGSATEELMDYEERLHELARGDDRVIFLGHRAGTELRQLIANAYAMVHASRSEGLSVAILEVMSYGKLVVMSDIPENLQLIDHSGVSFRVGDLKGLAEAMQWMVDDPLIVERRGERARRIVKNAYSWERVVERMIHLYRSL